MSGSTVPSTSPNHDLASTPESHSALVPSILRNSDTESGYASASSTLQDLNATDIQRARNGRSRHGCTNRRYPTPKYFEVNRGEFWYEIMGNYFSTGMLIVNIFLAFWGYFYPYFYSKAFIYLLTADTVYRLLWKWYRIQGGFDDFGSLLGDFEPGAISLILSLWGNDSSVLQIVNISTAVFDSINFLFGLSVVQSCIKHLVERWSIQTFMRQKQTRDRYEDIGLSHLLPCNEASNKVTESVLAGWFYSLEPIEDKQSPAKSRKPWCCGNTPSPDIEAVPSSPARPSAHGNTPVTNGRIQRTLSSSPGRPSAGGDTPASNGRIERTPSPSPAGPSAGNDTLVTNARIGKTSPSSRAAPEIENVLSSPASPCAAGNFLATGIGQKKIYWLIGTMMVSYSDNGKWVTIKQKAEDRAVKISMERFEDDQKCNFIEMRNAWEERPGQGIVKNIGPLYAHCFSLARLIDLTKQGYKLCKVETQVEKIKVGAEVDAVVEDFLVSIREVLEIVGRLGIHEVSSTVFCVIAVVVMFTLSTV